VELKTADKYLAGTDDSMRMTMIQDRMRSDPIYLDNAYRDDFERNK